MTTSNRIRDSRSVRLTQDEWDTAEAICQLSQLQGERVTAGLGIREALRIAEQRIVEDSGPALESAREEVRQRRTGRVGRGA